MKSNKFIDLSIRPSIINYKINIAIKKTIARSDFIMGREVMLLENQLKKICNVNHVVTCSSGTDAIIISLMSLKIKKNDIVFVPSFTFISTAESVILSGGVPFFVDVSPISFNISPKDLENGILKVKKRKLNICCIIAVDLFGKPCDFNDINLLSTKYKIPLIIDAAQSFGSYYYNKKVGSMSLISITSFFPTKTLGCFGDGGAIFTNDKNLYNIAKSIRNHGEGKNKYDNVRIGVNGRLDTIQAAILLEKLRFFKKEIKMRKFIAMKYNKYLKKYMQTPVIQKKLKSSWSCYTLVFKNAKIRNNLKFFLKKHLIDTKIYYTTPIHLQEAYKRYPKTKNILQVSENLSSRVLSLPIYPYMPICTINKIIFYILKFFKKV